MEINSVLNSNTRQVLNTNSIDSEDKALKLSTGAKVNRDDTAVSLKMISRSNAATENSEASLSDVNALDKLDGVISEAKKNIVRQPEDSIKAQANSTSENVTGLVQ